MSYVRRGDRVGWAVSPISLPSLWPTALSLSTYQRTEQGRANLKARLDSSFDSVYVAAGSPQIGQTGHLAAQVTARGDFGDSSHVASVITSNARNVGFIFSDSNIEVEHFQSAYPAQSGRTNGGRDESFLDYFAKDLKIQGWNLFDDVGLYIIAGAVVLAVILWRR